LQSVVTVTHVVTHAEPAALAQVAIAITTMLVTQPST
jgi:hypothetical protein